MMESVEDVVVIILIILFVTILLIVCSQLATRQNTQRSRKSIFDWMWNERRAAELEREKLTRQISGQYDYSQEYRGNNRSSFGKYKRRLPTITPSQINEGYRDSEDNHHNHYSRYDDRETMRLPPRTSEINEYDYENNEYDDNVQPYQIGERQHYEIVEDDITPQSPEEQFQFTIRKSPLELYQRRPVGINNGYFQYENGQSQHMNDTILDDQFFNKYNQFEETQATENQNPNPFQQTKQFNQSNVFQQIPNQQQNDMSTTFFGQTSQVQQDTSVMGFGNSFATNRQNSQNPFAPFNLHN